MPLLLSIDPGEKKAGVSLQSVKTGPNGEAELKLATRLLIKDLAKFIEDLHRTTPDFHLGYEEYKIFPNQRNLENHRFSPVQTAECIGIIKYVCMMNSIANIHHCMSYAHKQAVTDTWLKRYGVTSENPNGFWPQVNAEDNPHVRDAVKIGVFFWHICGIFNGGSVQNKKRVITSLDKEILGII